MDSLTLTTHERNLKLWLSRIRDCRASGQTVSCWCEHNGVGIKTYYYWMRKIKREAFDALPEKQKIKAPVSSSNHTFFAELPKQGKSFTEGTAVLIRFGGTVLEIQNGAEEATIENTLRVIKSLC